MAGKTSSPNVAEQGAMTESDLPPEFFALIERQRQRAKEAEIGVTLPRELESVREYARRAILPIKPVDASTEAEPKFLFTATRTDASDSLPPYYLVFFLLIDLLNFKNLGRFEKIAWSVPIDFEGRAYLIEHRKFGLGIFAHENDEENARRIVALIRKGVKVAQPFFKWMAQEAIHTSKFNVVNNASSLFARYLYMQEMYLLALEKLGTAKTQHEEDSRQREFSLWRRSPNGTSMSLSSKLGLPYSREWVALSKQVSWLALGAIDAFFSWTEHIFIHLAILQSRITTGEQVVQFIGAEWNTKFKVALDITDRNSKLHLERMVVIRQQLRNFMAHGAFGKEGEAFHFHSKAGAVPVVLEPGSRRKFSLNEKFGFNDREALASIEAFLTHLWSGEREPACLYIQESELPIILTMASDGKYAKAMSSVQAMGEFINHLLELHDAHSNMDW